MSYASDVTSEIDGKRYVVSTVSDRRTGGWQTAVLPRKFLGIPDVLHPMLCAPAAAEIEARAVHERVRDAVERLTPQEWAAAISPDPAPQADAAARAAAEREADASGRRDAADDPWAAFRGKRNSPEVLTAKTDVVAHLVSSRSHTGLDFALELAAKFKIPPANDQGRRQALAETAAFLIAMVEPAAQRSLNVGLSVMFVQGLVLAVAHRLVEKGMELEPGDFLDLYRSRRAEYAHYGPDKVGWKFADEVAEALGIKKNAMFNVMLPNLLGSSVLRWRLDDLLRSP